MAAQRQIRRLSGALRHSIAQMSMRYHPEILRGQVGVQLGYTKRWRSNFLRGDSAAAEKKMHDELFEKMSNGGQIWYKFNEEVLRDQRNEEKYAFTP